MISVTFKAGAARAVRHAVFSGLKALPSALQPRLVTVSLANGARFKLASPLETSLGTSVAVRGVDAFEPETVKLLQQLVPSCNQFIDAGANIGLITAQAKTFNANLKIVAFEPEARAFRSLRATVRANLWNDVAVENIALGENDGITTLFVPKGELEASTNPGFRTGATEVPCQIARLDSYCRTHGISSIDLLKIDTESTEPEVLRGGREVIGDCLPDIICEVLKGRTESELTEFLQDFGYRNFQITSNGLVQTKEITGDPTYRCPNYFFSCRR